MREVSAYGIEAPRWTVVFHRKAENRFFSAIAMGHFKHVSALAWVPELGQWWVYDVGFRRTHLRVLVDGPGAQEIIGAITFGNATVTMDVRDDGPPLLRIGMFCTTAIAHLLGLRCVALRPDALYRRMVKAGGVVRDDGFTSLSKNRDRPEPCCRSGASAEGAG
jgi:hypothetical protein